MHEPRTWRELLGHIISDPKEEQRLVEALGIRSITLTRWVKNKAEPRPYFLRQLLHALPQHHVLLLALIEEEFPGFSETLGDDVPKELPSAFYARILEAYTTTPPSVRFWPICELILQEALVSLDPERLGMELVIVRCMPPSQGNTIRSLREFVGLGTPPWGTDMEEKNLFLGAESLAGYVVSSRHFAVIQDINENRSFLPCQRTEHEKSAAAFPILLASNIAGCFLLSSTQPRYFVHPRLALIRHYTHVLALAFEPGEFYEPERIALGMMPAQHVQEASFSTLRQRVADTLLQAASKQQPMTNQQAEQLIRQQLEKELLQLPAAQG
jgi:hypothetical protein